MKNHLHSALLLGLMATLATGCSIYHPQSVDIPLINHSGDTRIDATAAMSFFVIPSTFTLNATATHGFNDWFAGQLHANYGGSNFYVQAAPGAYKTLGEKSVLEGYAGVGYGGAWNEKVQQESSSNNNYAYDGTFILPFVQGNFGWHDLSAAHIDIAFGLKCGAYLPDFNYRDLDADGNTVEGSYIYTTSNFLLEPQVMLRLGSSNVKLNIRLGFAWLSDLFSENSSAHNIYSDPLSASVGINFSF